MEEDTVCFSVIDDGHGLTKEELSNFFKPFPEIYIDGVTHGTGLGLSICKGIVELHGENIWAESDGIGNGSTFSFTLSKENRGCLPREEACNR